MPISQFRRLITVASPRRTERPEPAIVEPPEGPDAPTGLAATAVSATQIDLTWVDNSDNEDGFAINKGPPPGDTATEFFSVGPNVESFSDINVGPGEQWFYTVNAFNSVGSSPVSNKADATTPSVGDLNPDFYAPSGNLIEGQSYDLRARVLNPDQTIHTSYAPGDWDFTITVGGAFGSIGGANDDVLTLGASAAGNSITVRASYVGAEVLDPTFQDRTFNIVVQPTGNFPEVLEPPTGTVIESQNGSTKEWSGWALSSGWQDDNRVSVVSDPNSKFGNAIEKRLFEGESPGWHGTLSRNIGLWSVLYARLVYRFSSNWTWHSGGGKYVYFHSAQNAENYVLGCDTNQNAALNAFGIQKAPGRSVAVWDRSSGGGQWVSNLPKVPRGEYVTVEWLITADLGVDDGALRMALNGQEATDWIQVGGTTADLRSDVDWQYNDGVSDKRIGQTVEAFMFNGGSGGTYPNNMEIRLSEFFLKGIS